MITSNTSIPFIKAENSENKFYLSRLTSEYNEGDSITISTAINCRKLAIAIKAGDKIRINGTSLTVYADAAVDATSFFVEEITLDEALNINANIAIDEDNMFVQYQRKTEGTVAGFDIDADGMSKGGVEITGWLDSDTMEGATENNIPTAQSVKAYVDGQVGASDTLAEVLANGNATGGTNIDVSPNDVVDFFTGSNLNYGRIYANSEGLNFDTVANRHTRFFKSGVETMRINTSGNVGIGTTSPTAKLTINGTTDLGIDQYLTAGGNKVGYFAAGTNSMNSGTTDFRINNKADTSVRLTVLDSGNVGIGTTSPTAKITLADHTTAAGGIKFRTAASSVSLWSSGSGNLNTDKSFNVGSRLRVPGGNSAADPDIGFSSAASGTGFSRASNDITFITSAAEQMRITSTGNVGIGTTSPISALDVNGTISLNSDSENKLYFASTSPANGTVTNTTVLYGRQIDLYALDDIVLRTGTSSSDDIIFFAGNSEKARIKGSGNVGIGTTSPDYKLDVNGTQRVQDVLELEDVLTLNAISTPDDPDEGKSSIYMDSADGAIKVKINFEGEVVTRTIASFDG